MLGNLGKALGALLEEGSTHSSLDNFLGLANNGLSLVVFLLFLEPFKVLEFLVLVEFSNLGNNKSGKLSLLGNESDLLVSDGNLLIKFSLEFSRSLLGSGDFLNELGEISIAFFLIFLNENIILILSSFVFLLKFLHHVD